MKKIELNEVLTEEEPQLSTQGIAPGEIIIGTLIGFDDDGNGLVNYSRNQSNKPIIAISTVALTQNQSGRQVALLFADGNPNKPVIMGLIHSPLHEIIENFEVAIDKNETAQSTSGTEAASLAVDDIRLDGKRVILEGKEEVVLKCGEASITLTRAGKILIRGKYLLNRSSGVNRIMGGSVQVN